MSIKSSTNIGIYDVLSRIIPGGAMLFSLYVYNIVTSSYDGTIPSFLSIDSTVGVFVFVIVLFVIGEIVNIIRIAIHPVPSPFRDMISIQSSRHEPSIITSKLRTKLNNFILFLPIPKYIKNRITFNEKHPVRSRFQHGFWIEFKKHFEIDEEVPMEDIWELFSIYIETESTEEISRVKTNLHFVTNLLISIAFGLYIVPLSIVFSPENWPLALLYFSLLTVLTIFVIPLFYIIEVVYMNKLLALYYFSRET